MGLSVKMDFIPTLLHKIRPTTTSSATVSVQHPDNSYSSHSSSAPTTTRDRSPLRKSVNIASKDDWIGSLFHCATINQPVININITQQLQQPRRKRYNIIYDSDDE